MPAASATVQSVLAVAGAGLFAVAAIVFTFFNPDLTDHAARGAIVGATTLVFLVGARLLQRRGLRFSAEAVGALGGVFLALDVHAFAELAPAGVSPWLFAAIGTLVAGTGMTALAVRFGIRSWLWLSLLALAFVPAMLGIAGTTDLAATLGWLASAAAALALLETTTRLSRRLGDRLLPERVALTVAQLLSVAATVALLPFADVGSPAARSLAIAGVLTGVAVLALLATRQLIARVWGVVAGLAGTAAAAVAPSALEGAAIDPAAWPMLVTSAAAVVGMLLLGAVLPLPRTAPRRHVAGGALAVVALTAALPLLASLAIGALALLTDVDANAGDPDLSFGGARVPYVVAGLAVIAAGLRGYAALARGPRWIGALGAWFGAASVLTLVCSPALSPAGRVALGLAAAVAASVALVVVRPLRDAAVCHRLPLVVGAHLAVVLCAVMSWRVDDLVVAAGGGILVCITAVARATPSAIRFLHVGVGYAYALLVFARALNLAGVDTLLLLCLTTSLGAVGAIAATFLRPIGARSWWAILAVTAVPFGLGVLQVVFERSGWTALSTSLIFLLALALVVTRRPGLGVALRALAGAMLVPSLSVVVVCLGAQLLASSGSPVVLPVVAAIVALALPSTRTLALRGVGERDAAAARLAIEASALLTGAIAVALSLAREAAGLGTTCLVLAILGVGAAATSLWGGRRYGWWVAGAAFTGALWCVWALGGVDLVEPYVLPPALAAALVGAVLTARGARAVPLYAAGLAVAIAPVLVLLAATGTPAPVAWRAHGLVVASWLLLALGAWWGRREHTRALRLATLVAAIAAGAAGAVQGVRLGLGLDPGASTMPLVVVCAAIAFLGAVPAFAAARAIHSSAAADSRLARTRWLHAPATLYLAAGTWTAIERDWLAIWAMWALMLGYLVAVVVVAWRLRTRPSSLPPVWFVFAIAFVTAVVAWSPRALRVEWFSLPLGAFLLAAGALRLRRGSGRPRTVDSWPAGWDGSWPLLAPGLVVLLSASVAATFTDPLTWRAILVLVVALCAILVGASRGLAAPFVVGVVVLPVENALAFLVQIGRGIESMPWWITLAVVGAVLLIIAVTHERRTGEGGFAARLRDLA
ncbi:MAG: hypothetical protein QM611_03620 [Microbacterium sp.]|uniref:SCO7613 C-terminal domain-containing membrane protein n=1 Tax=Microbacterium sp. TaxID=51671 RepID=UPI0039E38A8E